MARSPVYLPGSCRNSTSRVALSIGHWFAIIFPKMKPRCLPSHMGASRRIRSSSTMSTTSQGTYHTSSLLESILVIFDGPLSSIIDWSLARFRPIRMALGFPALLSPGRDNKDPSSAPVLSSSDLQDRRNFVAHLSSLVSDQASPVQGVSVASDMKAIDCIGPRY